MYVGGFYKWWYPKMDRFIMENPIKIDDLWVLPILGNLKIIMFCLYLPWLPSGVASVVGEEPSRGPLFTTSELSNLKDG